jgi:hypothetical protein
MNKIKNEYNRGIYRKVATFADRVKKDPSETKPVQKNHEERAGVRKQVTSQSNVERTHAEKAGLKQNPVIKQVSMSTSISDELDPVGVTSEVADEGGPFTEVINKEKAEPEVNQKLASKNLGHR